MPYEWVASRVTGQLLEVGCGEGRGISLLWPHVQRYDAIDKMGDVLAGLQKQWPEVVFRQANLPPLPYPDATFDTVVTFQVIEHIADDALFLQEIARVLKPGGQAFVTTPNRLMSLSRNPWHVREYTGPELAERARPFFSEVTLRGISGHERVRRYHARNQASVQRLMRWDVLDLQHRLPAWMLRLPYEWLNRRNRKKLQQQPDSEALAITTADYFVSEATADALDLFLIARK